MANYTLKASTGVFTVTGTSTTGAVTVTLPVMKSGATMGDRSVSSKNIQSAVYAHIQAVRALGRTQIEPEEIARALGLTISQVNGTLAALKNKGVKAIHAP